MLNNVFVKQYPAPTIDEREILRYAGYQGDVDGQTQALLSSCIQEHADAFSYRVCYLVMCADELLSRLGKESKLLTIRLGSAEYALVFAGTVGLEMDRRMLRAEVTSTAKALLLQAFGTERIESLCDTFCGEIEAECQKRGYKTGTRFSAGYGDFPLEKQRELFSVLACEKHIGLTLNDSLLMTPTKSVTAILPIGKARQQKKSGCAVCGKQDCSIRK